MPHRPVSVVVTTCGDSPDLRQCLARIVGQAAALGAEVLVAVNAPDPDVAPGLRSALADLGVRLVVEPDAGKSSALNAAVREAEGSVVAFTDDDTLPDPGWLEAITRPLRGEEAAPSGCGGPVLPLFPAGGPPVWFRRLLARTDSTVLGPYHFPGSHPRDYVESALGHGLPFGANCAYAREVLRAHPYRTDLGPNRTTGLRGGEDTELALSLLRAGHRIAYVPGARVFHPVREDRMTLDFVRERHRVLGRETVRLLRALCDAVPAPAGLERRIRRAAVGRLRRWLGGRDRALRRELRRATLEGALQEVLQP